MYLGTCRTCRPAPRSLRGLGFDPLSVIGPIAGALLNKGAGDSGPVPGDFGPGTLPPGAAAAPPITVSPAIQTSISPNISPVFQQSYMPSGSPMTAGTQQVMPTSQGAATGAPADPGIASGGAPYIPGGAGAYPTRIGGNWPPGLPDSFVDQPGESALGRYLPWILGGGLAIGALVLLMRKRGNVSRG